MSNVAVYRLASDWQKALLKFPEHIRSYVKEAANVNKQLLASYFYDCLLGDEAANVFLSHDEVQKRLSSSLQKWLSELFSVTPEDDFVALVELQRQVGDVHARIDLPLYLVLSGARLLKERFFEIVEAEERLPMVDKMAAQQFIAESIDIAIEFMSRAYAASYDRRSRAEESYRVFAAVHNSAAERGRQRAALLDWENNLMFELATGMVGKQLSTINSSEFGLWFHHKGAHAFENLKETDVIQKTMEHIDHDVLPRFALAESGTQLDVLRELRTQTRLIILSMDLLFEQQNEVEAGRDTLTKLLGRKYLPVVLGREVAYSRRRGVKFALLSIDLDHFKRVNDEYGHESGDAVLRQFAELLNAQCRAGDYIFRLGGEEFLVLLVDVNVDTAMRIAKKISERIQKEKFVLPFGHEMHLTASMGLALYDGHPDYTPTLRRVDKALYQAKHAGRNRIELLT